ncbi:hypothetical protein Tco_1101927 [Tanacetum coccineum]
MIDQGVTTALTARYANKNGDDSHTSGTGARRTERVTRECTYQDFMKCQPLYFKGTKGVVELTQWFERMGPVISISNCSVENTDHVLSLTLLAGALTWWNSHVRIVGHDVAYKESDKVEKETLNNNHQAQQQLSQEAGNVVQAYAAETVKEKSMQELYTALQQVQVTSHKWPKHCKMRKLQEGHYKSDCPKLKNQNHGNQAEGTGTHGMVLALGGGETDQDPNNIEDEIEA